MLSLYNYSLTVFRLSVRKVYTCFSYLLFALLMIPANRVYIPQVFYYGRMATAAFHSIEGIILPVVRPFVSAVVAVLVVFTLTPAHPDHQNG